MRPKRHSTGCITALSLFLGGIAFGDSAATVVSACEPQVDRWNYDQNTTVGYRNKSSLFTGLPDDAGNGADRLGQITLGFDTTTMGVPAGGSWLDYRITSVKVTARFANDPSGLGDSVILYDPTPDPFDALLPGGIDPDPGRPVELHGVGFRNGFSAATYVEGAPPPALGQPPIPGSPYSGVEGRTAYALGYDECGVPRDVTNNPSGRLRFAAVGGWDQRHRHARSADPGRHHPDLRARPQPAGVTRYLQQGLSDGWLYFTLSSMQPATFDGGGGGLGNFAIFYMKESVEHQFFGDSAATLEIIYELIPSEEVASATRFDGPSNEVRVEWNAAAGECFTVYESTDLKTWQIAAEVEAHGTGVIDYPVPVAGNPEGYFHVRRKLP